MYRRPDIINWAVLVIVSIGTTMYLVGASRLVANGQDSIMATWTSVGASGSTDKKNNNEEKTSMDTVILKTNFGAIELELFRDMAPNTVENFLKLVTSGFYDGTRFHRVIKGFMIQGGDPLSKDIAMQDRWGTGGPGYKFADEIHAENRNIIGTISMANAGLNTNGSQFFINTANNNFLDTKHTVFGKVVAGMDVVTAIENVKTIQPGQLDRPAKEVVIEKVEIK